MGRQTKRSDVMSSVSQERLDIASLDAQQVKQKAS